MDFLEQLFNEENKSPKIDLPDPNSLAPINADLLERELNEANESDFSDSLINGSPNNQESVMVPVNQEFNTTTASNNTLIKPISSEPTNLNKYQELLEKFKKLTQKPEENDEYQIAANKQAENLRNLQYLQSINLLGSAMSKRFGGSVSETPDLNRLQEESARMPLTDFLNKRKLDVENLKNQILETEGQKQLSQLQQQEKSNDPLSRESQIYRKMIETKYPSVVKAYGDKWNEVSAADSDLLFKPLQLAEQIESRKEQSKLLAQSKTERAQEHLEAKQEKAALDAERYKDKQIRALQDSLDPNKPRGGNLGKSQAMYNSAERIEGLFNQFPDGNVPKSQTVELATAVAGLISGGGSPQSQKQIEELVPQSMQGKFEDIASWVTNEPRGLKQQKFMKLLQHTANREKNIALNQIRKAQVQRLAAFKDFSKKYPEDYQQVVQSFGIDVNKDIDEKGLYIVPNLDEHKANDEIRRKTKDGRIAIFDQNKKFIRFED